MAMRGRLRIEVSIISLLITAMPLLAHHSFSAEYDAQLPVTLTGTITRVERTNPHGWIFIDVKRPDGSVVSWGIETGGPLQLARRGVKKDTLKIGMVVVVRGYRAKDGSATANGDDMKLPDGTNLFLGSSAGDAPYADKAKAIDSSK
jgi:hypothetical protein